MFWVWPVPGPVGVLLVPALITFTHCSLSWVGLQQLCSIRSRNMQSSYWRIVCSTDLWYIYWHERWTEVKITVWNIFSHEIVPVLAQLKLNHPASCGNQTYSIIFKVELKCQMLCKIFITQLNCDEPIDLHIWTGGRELFYFYEGAHQAQGRMNTNWRFRNLFLNWTITYIQEASLQSLVIAAFNNFFEVFAYLDCRHKFHFCKSIFKIKYSKSLLKE